MLLENKWGKYSLPTLVTHKKNLKKQWFAKFWWHPHGAKNGNYRQLRGGINTFHTVRERLSAGNNLLEVIKTDLKANWNPKSKKYARQMTDEQRWANMELNVALKETMNVKKGIYSSTRERYNDSVRFFNEAYTRMEIHVQVKDVKPSTISKVMDEYQAHEETTNQAFNMNLRNISAIFSKLCKLADLLHNPCKMVERKVTKKTQGFKMPTDDQKAMLKKLDLINPRLYVIGLVEYHTGIRPKEILKLKIGDLKGGHFIILPDPEKENSKTDAIGFVPIPQQLMERLERMELHKYPDDWYIFGKPEGRRNELNTDQYYLPSPHPVQRIQLTQEWNRVVIKGLKINAHLYGMKHRGAVDSRKAGMSLDAIRDKLRHSKISTTEIYLEKLMNMHTEEILNKSPDF